MGGADSADGTDDHSGLGGGLVRDKTGSMGHRADNERLALREEATASCRPNLNSLAYAFRASPIFSDLSSRGRKTPPNLHDVRRAAWAGVAEAIWSTDSLAFVAKLIS